MGKSRNSQLHINASLESYCFSNLRCSKPSISNPKLPKPELLLMHDNRARKIVKGWINMENIQNN